MKSFDELYEMYRNDDEHLYDLTDVDAICELIDECDKDLTKYGEFKHVLCDILDDRLDYDYELYLAIMNELDFDV